jgi:hypothetical protein
MAMRRLLKGLFLSLLFVVLNQLIVPVGFPAMEGLGGSEVPS